MFYKHCNVLKVSAPQLEILPIENLKFETDYRLHFATINAVTHLYFDTFSRNAADQWNIKRKEGFCITMTMASFWSNKIWKWIEEKGEIWR